MSANFNPNTKEVVKVTPFRGWVYERFPFIQEDFDSLTSYELWCKVVEYINKMVESVNTNADNNNELVKAYSDLQDYVNNYFDNLDVQTEIDNKLDEMASDGTLDEIINQEIFGELNSQVETNTNAIDTLVNTTIPAIEEDIENLSTPDDYYVMIGDSYCYGSGNDGIGWSHKIKSKLNLDNSHCYIFSERGGGLVRRGQTNKTMLELIQDNYYNIVDPTKITKILYMGGINDTGESLQTLITAYQNFVEYLKINFPNATIYVGCISGDIRRSNTSQVARAEYYNIVLDLYSNSIQYGCDVVYLYNLEQIMKNPNYFYSDRIHPNNNGYDVIANAIIQAIKKDYKAKYHYTTTLPIANSDTNMNFSVYVDGENAQIQWLATDIELNSSVDTSSYYIYLTTNNIATSQYSNDEISQFRKLYGFPVIVGLYHDGAFHNYLAELYIDGDGKIRLYIKPSVNAQITGISRIYMYAQTIFLKTTDLFLS